MGTGAGRKVVIGSCLGEEPGAGELQRRETGLKSWFFLRGCTDLGKDLRFEIGDRFLFPGDLQKEENIVEIIFSPG